MERLKVSANGRFLVTESGQPFFWLGDTAWELFHRLSREQAEHYLTNRAAKAFNVVQAVVLAERDGLHTPNVYGDAPLVDDDPMLWNEAYFAHVDMVLQQSEANGLYVGLLPTWGDKVDLVGGAGPVIFNAYNARVFGEMIGARYRDQPNIVWILGGDRYPDGFEAVWRAMAHGIRTGAGDSALITYHPRGTGQSSTRLHDEDWLSFNMIQSGHGAYDMPVWETVAQDYALTPAKPTLDAEPPYETHPVAFASDLRYGRFSEYDVRKAAYRSVLEGACGHTYGHHSVWQMFDARYEPVTNPEGAWHEVLDAPGAYQMQHLRRLIESRPMLTRIPDDRLVVEPDQRPERHVSASRDSDGTYAFVYVPSGGQSVTVDIRYLSGERLRVWWFNPRTGTATNVGTVDRADKLTVSTPDDGDAVLVLDDSGQRYAAPGKDRADRAG